MGFVHLDLSYLTGTGENIDMMAMAGRECGHFTLEDIAPVALIWGLLIACYLVILSIPLQNCQQLTDCEAVDTSRAATYPILPILTMATIGAALWSILAEIWRMWHPFRGGVNTTAWTCAIALEIDKMVNDFYEDDPDSIVRAHAYMGPPVFVGQELGIVMDDDRGPLMHHQHSRTRGEGSPSMDFMSTRSA